MSNGKSLVVAAITVVAALGAPSPASASPLSAEAVFAGTLNRPACAPTQSTCTMTEKSIVCQAVGVDASMFAYSGGCYATLEYTVSRLRVDRASACAGTYPGRLTLELASGQKLGVDATVVVGELNATFTTASYASLGTVVYVGQGSGNATSICAQGGDDVIRSTFSGRFSYVRL